VQQAVPFNVNASLSQVLRQFSTNGVQGQQQQQPAVITATSLNSSAVTGEIQGNVVPVAGSIQSVVNTPAATAPPTANQDKI
jgi:hypothetical protein